MAAFGRSKGMSSNILVCYMCGSNIMSGSARSVQWKCAVFILFYERKITAWCRKKSNLFRISNWNYIHLLGINWTNPIGLIEGWKQLVLFFLLSRIGLIPGYPGHFRASDFADVRIYIRIARICIRTSTKFDARQCPGQLAIGPKCSQKKMSTVKKKS